ncbi:MAG: hypothetical protein ACTHMR_17855 [Thermomicrobiales bacterium]
MRRALLAACAAACHFCLFIAPTSAAAEWCETDPLVILTTPQGNSVPVYVTEYAHGAQYQPNLDGTIITSAATGTRAGGTQFDMHVTVPEAPVAGHFATRAIASTAPSGAGVVYDTASGRSGLVLHLTFTVAVP